MHPDQAGEAGSVLMLDERSPLVREALRWFAVLRDDEATDADRQALEQWKGRSAEHAAAWERASSLWSAFEPVEKELRSSRRRKVTRRAFMGSSLGLIAAGSGAYLLYRDGKFADYATAAGERRSLTLADGSGVDLDSRSALSVDYSATRRRLVLHWGEAYFSVAPDSARPFTVAAAGGETRALGTRFNIHADDGLTTVTVAEHEVEVTLPRLVPERISAGWQLAYAPDRMSAPVEIDVAGVGAWRRGRLIYRGAPLRRVLHDIERHRGGFVLLTDTSLGEMPVSAAFDSASADAAIDSIARMLPMRVRRAGSLVVVSRR